MSKLPRRYILKSAPLAIVAASLPTLATDAAADSELYRLGAQFEASWADEEVHRIEGRRLNTAEAWEPWDRAYARTEAIVNQIEALPAHSARGIRIKARCIQWCYGDDLVELGSYDTTDSRLASAIVRDLLAMGVPTNR